MIVVYIIIALILFGFVLWWLGQGKGTPVLLYHQVNPLIHVTPELFEEHLKYIASRYQTFTLSEAYAYVKKEGALPKHALLLTFDDGYYDNYYYVFPLLKKYNIKATFFLNTLFISDAVRTSTVIEESEQANKAALLKYYETGNAETLQYMTVSEIQEMHRSGLCDFQAHTHTHAPVIVHDQLLGFREEEHQDSSPIHIYAGKVVKGFPVFKTRSTVTYAGFRLDRIKALLFAQEYEKNWSSLPKEEALKQAQKYIHDHHVLVPFSDKEAASRVQQEILVNKLKIEKITQTPVQFFAWTWGHHSNWGKKLIQQEGIIGLATCKKGGIGLKPRWDQLNRVELRNPSLKNLKRILSLTTNRFTSLIYSLVS